MDRSTRTVEELLTLLDGLFPRGADWWDGFYADRERPVPFFTTKPDESLVEYLDRGAVAPGGRALDLGCGPGRNALHLAQRGFEVDAVDLSETAIAWAAENARSAGAADLRFHHGDAFALAGTALTGRYDLICDSGCFHHLPPHRRISYLALLERHLAVGGHLLLSCFAADDGDGDEEEGGSSVSDAELYRDGSLHGGLGYTPEALRRIFADLTEVELRRMRDEPDDSGYFGEPFLWVALFRRDLLT